MHHDDCKDEGPETSLGSSRRGVGGCPGPGGERLGRYEPHGLHSTRGGLRSETDPCRQDQIRARGRLTGRRSWSCSGTVPLWCLTVSVTSFEAERLRVGGKAMAYAQPEPLRGKHDLGDFQLRQESLDNWLHRYSRHAEAAGSARVFVTTDDARVVGYYAFGCRAGRARAGNDRLTQRSAEGKCVRRGLGPACRRPEPAGRWIRPVTCSRMLSCAVREPLGQSAYELSSCIAHEEARELLRALGFEPSPATDSI